MNTLVARETKFEWRQNSLKFAVSDFRRNWPRWLFCAVLYFATVAFLTAVTGPDPHPRYTPPDPRIFWPVIFLGCIGIQFLAAVALWSVKIDNERITLGHARYVRHYRFKKIAHIGFARSSESCSMLLGLSSGKRVEIFIDTERIQIDELKRHFSFAGISVSDRI